MEWRVLASRQVLDRWAEGPTYSPRSLVAYWEWVERSTAMAHLTALRPTEVLVKRRGAAPGGGVGECGLLDISPHRVAVPAPITMNQLVNRQQ